MTVIVPLIVALALALALMPLARRLAVRYDLVDHPVARSSHTTPTPFGGGHAIFLAFWVTTFALGWPLPRPLIGLFIGSVVLLIVCTIDDKRNLPALPRLLVQLLVGLIAYVWGVRVVQIANPLDAWIGPEFIMMGLFELPVTVLWIAFVINAMNWLDGLDGLAGGISAIAATTLAVVAASNPQAFIIVVPVAALAGSAIGFLRYNFPPASIFMGDSGAMFLGYMLASLSVIGAVKGPAAVVLFVPLLVLGLPIYDSATTILNRLRQGRPPHHPDRGHLHHRLRDSGLSVRETVLIMYAITGLLCVIALGVWLR
ncbi:MAG: MraY family glycosyltransferase [Armatimonadota bacterium]|jgi:UDP-GlcNAc:undecaprenyl-phosphate GlcNAc-1-phosphate transferase